MIVNATELLFASGNHRWKTFDWKSKLWRKMDALSTGYADR